MSASVDEEIRKLQVERGQMEGRLVSFNSVSYDKDLYGGADSAFDTSIAGTHSPQSCICSFICAVDDADFEEEAEQASRGRFQDKQQESKKS